ncbi:unnamed protein product [Larinioides sclopetarius]|uniref:Uncharacterized protein n=1 Tax=Larinioides sclopetarius TaxID=280406 RepID=A0AAV2AU51_9ARAC
MKAEDEGKEGTKSRTAKAIDFQIYFKYLKKNFYSFKSDNLSGAIKEFCSYNDSKEQDVFDKTVNADFSFQKKTSAEGEDSKESGLKQATNCTYKLLKKLNSEGKC